MTKADVLAAVTFWGESTWGYIAGRQPSSFSSNDRAAILNSIDYLYDHSPTAQSALERLAAQGPIRFGYKPADAYYTPFFTTQSGGTSDAYINIDPNLLVKAMDQYGLFFTIDFNIILGHELSHWANNVADVVQVSNPVTFTPNSVANQPDYDYKGDNLPYEWAISDELGLWQFRVSYGATLAPNDPLAADPWHSYAPQFPDGEYHKIDIARFGDHERLPDSSVDYNDIIDFSRRSGSENILVFALSGDDTVKGGSGVNWLYGGDGSDTLIGGSFLNYLDGGSGDDRIAAVGQSATVNAGDGNDFILVKTINAELTLGAGSDSVFVNSLWPGSWCQIDDAEANDLLYWNGHLLTGGTKMLVDVEEGDFGSGNAIYYEVGQVDEFGVVYHYAANTDSLGIDFPDGSYLVIADYQYGDFGLAFDSPVLGDNSEFRMVFDPPTRSWHWESDLDMSSICLDGSFRDHLALPGAMDSLTYQGPAQLPAELAII